MPVYSYLSTATLLAVPSKKRACRSEQWGHLGCQRRIWATSPMVAMTTVGSDYLKKGFQSTTAGPVGIKYWLMQLAWQKYMPATRKCVFFPFCDLHSKSNVYVGWWMLLFRVWIIEVIFSFSFCSLQGKMWLNGTGTSGPWKFFNPCPWVPTIWEGVGPHWGNPGPLALKCP